MNKLSKVSGLNIVSGLSINTKSVFDLDIPMLFEAPIPKLSFKNTSILSYFNSNDFLITHTFRENNSNYGDGIDNTSYQVKKEIRIEKGLKKLPLNRIGLESIFAELDDDTFAYLHQAKTNRLMRI